MIDDIKKILARLNLIKNYILLGDYGLVEEQILLIKKTNLLNNIENILQLFQNENYSSILNEIESSSTTMSAVIDILNKTVASDNKSTDDVSKKNYTKEDVFIIWQKGYCGIAHNNNILITEIIYDDAILFEDGYISLKLNGKWGVFDFLGNQITDLKYDHTKKRYFHPAFDEITNEFEPLFHCGLALVCSDGLYGFIDKNGVEVIKIQFTDVFNFREGIAAVRFLNKSSIVKDQHNDLSKGYSFIDIQGNVISKQTYFKKGHKFYGDAFYFKNGLVLVEKDNKFGYVDTKGNECTPLIYDDAALYFTEGYANVIDNKINKVINSKGEYLIPNTSDSDNASDNKPTQYSNVEIIKDFGYNRHDDAKLYGFKAQLNGYYKLFNSSCQEISSLNYNDINDFYEDCSIIRLNWKYGCINKAGQIIIEPLYDSIHNFKNGIAMVSLNKKFGFVDKNGKQIIPIIYDNAEQFGNNFFKVYINPWSGILDSNNREIIPIIYDGIRCHYEGYATLNLNNKDGLIYEYCKEITALRYDNIYKFKNGRLKVEINGKYGYIDKIGNEVIPLKYDEIDELSESLYSFKINDKYGYIDYNGNIIIQNIYDFASPFVNGFGKVWLNDKVDLVNKNGQTVANFMYDHMKAGDNYDDPIYCMLKNKCGYIDINNNEITTLKFFEAEKFKFGYGRVKLTKEDDWQFIDKFGDFVMVNDDVIEKYKKYDESFY